MRKPFTTTSTRSAYGLARVANPCHGKSLALAFALAIVLSGTSCKREERSFRVPPPAADPPIAVSAKDDVRPFGGGEGTPPTTYRTDVTRMQHEPYRTSFPQNAQANSDGQTF